MVVAAGTGLDPSEATGAWSRRHAKRSGRRRPVIPYFELREIPIGGGRSVAAFGTLVALGILAGAWFAERRARVVGVPPQEIPAAILSAVVPGLLVAHLVALLPQVGGTLAWSPQIVLEFWNGMSPFGGFAGALLGLTAFSWWRGRCSPRLDGLLLAVAALVAPDGRCPGAGARRWLGVRPARLHPRARSPREAERIPARDPLPGWGPARSRPLRAPLHGPRPGAGRAGAQSTPAPARHERRRPRAPVCAGPVPRGLPAPDRSPGRRRPPSRAHRRTVRLPRSGGLWHHPAHASSSSGVDIATCRSCAACGPPGCRGPRGRGGPPAAPRRARPKSWYPVQKVARNGAVPMVASGTCTVDATRRSSGAA